MSLVDIKTQARSSLHGAMAVPAIYQPPGSDTTYPTPEQAAAGLTLTARWHNKLVRNGAIEGAFDGEVIEGVNRLVFQQPQLDALGITLAQRGAVTMPGYAAAFELDTEEPGDGPLNVYWNVSRDA